MTEETPTIESEEEWARKAIESMAAKLASLKEDENEQPGTQENDN